MNRPEHDDFWSLAAVVQDVDSATDDGTSFERIVSPIVDVESVVYMAEQRAGRAMGMSPRNPLVRVDPAQMAKLAALWVDGFVAGALYQKRKEQK